MIYLDHAATTPLDPAVREAMLQWLDAETGFGNPASDHALGHRARAAVEAARDGVAALIGAGRDEIVWTSGATESNNLAIKGALEFRGRQRAHVVSSRIEHKSVLDTCRYLETQGATVTYLTPDAQGLIGVEQVLAALRPDTALVSLMWVNNETGAINPVEALAPLLRERGILFHVDAVQAAGKLQIDLARTPIDLLSLSAHKLYGPKGIGALFVRKRPRARLTPQIHGGGHEQGMRSGTLATHQIVGFGTACRLALAALPAEAVRLASLRDALWRLLQARVPGLLRNGVAERSVPGILNLSFPGVEGEALRASLPELMVSSGSACSSATREPSYVLRALGRDDELAGSSLRLSLGRGTDAAQLESAAAQIGDAVARLRAVAGADAVTPTRALQLDANVHAYSTPIWQRFTALAHAGASVAGLSASVGSQAAKARLALWVHREGGRLHARFQACGCPVTIAVGEWLAEQIEVMPWPQLAAIDAALIRNRLEINEDKAHCSFMGEDVLRALLQQAPATGPE